MSLLIKALEQAAKDRDGMKPATSGAAGASEPTLEPPPAPRARQQEVPSASSRTSTAPTHSSPALTLDATSSPKRGASPGALTDIDAQQQRARAAAVVQAARSSDAGVLSYFRANPVMAFGACAGLFAAAFGTYVYLQVAKPHLFMASRPAPSAGSSAPPAAMQQGAPAASAASPSADSISSGNVTAAGSGAGPALPSPVHTSTNQSAQPGSGGPISTASIIGNPQADDRSGISSEREATPQTDAGGARNRTAFATRRSGSPPPAEPAGRERIAVTPTATQPRVNPVLSQAYSALQAGNMEEARAAYAKITQSEPLNTDAWLGLAYIAAQENRSDDAMKTYLRILQINPRHAAAQAALIGMMGRADPVASETRLKQLMSREPSAFLHFVLGNLYADQSLWSQAQQAYFQAHHMEPDNADYAYNLAIGLDHLRQTKLALGFYRRAEQLAAGQGRVNFDLRHARERISMLSSQLD
jgi:Flp pilus assembly protein TadD